MPPQFASIGRDLAYFNKLPITIMDRDAHGNVVSALRLATVSGEVALDSPPADPSLLQALVRVSLDPWTSTPASRIEGRIPSSFVFQAVPSLRYDVRVSGQPGYYPVTLPFPLYVKDVSVGTSSILRKPFIAGSEPPCLRWLTVPS